MTRVPAILCAALVALAWGAQGQRVLFETPNKASLQISEVYLRNDIEFEREFQEAGAPSVSIARERVLIQPAVGVGFSGWAYHPNLLQYSAQTELGLDWQNSNESPGDSATDTRFLQRYHVAIDILRQKPFAVGLFADKDMSYRDYDFFSRVPVDSERYGGRAGFSAGAVPFSVTAQHYEEQVDDLTRPSWLKEDTLSFNAYNYRREGQANTQLSYNLNSYSRRDNGYSDQDGLNQNVSFFDGEKFGSGGWIQFNSLLNYNSVTETEAPSDKLLIQENLRLQHTERLASFYEYAFDLASFEDSDSTTHQGRVGLTHQLYDNLTSTLDVHGLSSSSSSPGSSLDYQRFGVTLNEQYTRPLQTWGNLWLGYQGSAELNERDSIGSIVQIIDEPHTLTDGTLTFLNLKSVLVSTINVTDPTSTLVYVEGLDYLIIPHAPLTEIRRVPGGRIPNGSQVLVDYQAVLDPSGSYYSYDNSVSFRLDLWKGLLGIYGRWTTLDFSGGEDLDLRWINDQTVGIDSTWRWFRAGAEYETLDSNYSPFDRVRLFQSAQFQPGQASSFGLNLDQSWTTYPNEDRKQTSYGFIAHYEQRLSQALHWRVEGGVRIERGDTFDRDYGTVRTELDYVVGKLALKLGYEYGQESHPTDFRDRHYLYFRLRRNF